VKQIHSPGAMPAAGLAKPATASLRRWGLPAILLGLGIFGALASVAWWQYSSRPTDLSIAVLPLENHANARDTEYLALGIQDELLTLLTHIPDLRVVPRTSTLRYAQSEASVPQIGRALGVSHLLQGSVQRAGDRVRVHVVLVDAAADRQVWAQTYERPATDVFAIESEVAQSVATALRLGLTEEQRRDMAQPPTRSPEAYDAYLRARASAERTTRTEEEILAAIHYYEAAVRADPLFAQAWAQLSRRNANFFSLAYDRSDSRRESALRALEEAEKLAPDRIEIQAARGYFLFVVEGDLDGAERIYRGLETRAPQSADAAAGLSQILAERGQLDRSADYARRVLALDALNPYRHSIICQQYSAARQFAAALQTCKRALELLPGDVGLIAIEAGVLQAMGELDRSRVLLRSVSPAPGDWRTLRVMTRQMLLDRDTTAAISLLKRSLESPEAWGTRRGLVRRWLADAYRLAGDTATAKETYELAAGEIENELERQPSNPVLVAELVTVRGRLGLYEAAIRLMPRCLELASRPWRESYRTDCGVARISAEIAGGDPARAVLALKEALEARSAMQPLTPALLARDPDFDPLRDRPDFRELLNGDRPGVAKSAP
jgi:TolB-like protein